jgi:hypothetical protein
MNKYTITNRRMSPVHIECKPPLRLRARETREITKDQAEHMQTKAFINKGVINVTEKVEKVIEPTVKATKPPKKLVEKGPKSSAPKKKKGEKSGEDGEKKPKSKKKGRKKGSKKKKS